MEPILDHLNDAQLRAVLHGTGPLLVVAGAGSGKTRVVTRRVARLLADGEDPDSVLALTFTNKAAGEMARRVQALGGYRVLVSTFHSACARFLRRDGEAIGYPRRFSIYDTFDRDSCLKVLIADHGIRARVTPGEVGRRISRLKNELIRPAEFRELRLRSELDQVVSQVYGAYEARMREQAAMDFDDLLINFVELLEAHPDVAEAYRQRFRWLLVDEFQDTNRVQYRIARLLAGDGERNICVVGDPDQSIYRFRGAELGNLLGFTDDFPDATVVKLEQNYRSTACILRAAQGLIEHNSERLDKVLRPVREEGDKIRLAVAANAPLEARYVVDAVAAMLAAGVPADEMAVFYRAHHLSRPLEEQFRRRGIDYKLIGGVTFYERREVKDLLSYLRVAVNPLDDVAMERIINVPPRRIGKKTLQDLRAAAAAEGMSLYEAVADDEIRGRQKPRVRDALATLAEVLAAVRIAGEQSARAALASVIDGVDYIEYACTLGDLADYSREDNIMELVNDAAVFDSSAEAGGGGLAAWLQFVALLTAEDQASDQPAVSLMTVHAAKGLEFEHVWVAALDQGVFPHTRSLGDPVELEEERRLLYVAITRARTSLTLTRARERMIAGAVQSQSSSQFLQELPADCLHKVGGGVGLGSDPDWDADSLGDGIDIDFAVDGDDEAVVEMASADNIELGTAVVHRVYGRGVVVRTSGRGIQARVVVRFGSGDERELLLEFAQLRLEQSGEEW